MKCIHCSSTKFNLRFHSYSFDDASEVFDIVECDTCHLARVEPFPDLGQLHRYYANDYYGSQSTSKFTGPVESLVRLGNKLRARAILKYLETDRGKSAPILDVGCGRGEFLKELSRQGMNCWGTDIADFKQLESTPGIRFFQGPLTSAPFEAASFEAVSIWHVLEHTPDATQVLSQIKKILKPGGVLAIAVPHFESFQSKLFRGHWFHLDLPRHLFHFSKKTLLELLKERDLEILKVSTQSWEQNLYGFVQSSLNVLMGNRYPNHLYSLLKSGNPTLSQSKRLVYLVAYLPLVLILIVFGILENLFSISLGRGATLIVYARNS